MYRRSAVQDYNQSLGLINALRQKVSSLKEGLAKNCQHELATCLINDYGCFSAGTKKICTFCGIEVKA